MSMGLKDIHFCKKYRYQDDIDYMSSNCLDKDCRLKQSRLSKSNLYIGYMCSKKYMFYSLRDMKNNNFDLHSTEIGKKMHLLQSCMLKHFILRIQNMFHLIEHMAFDTVYNQLMKRNLNNITNKPYTYQTINNIKMHNSYKQSSRYISYIISDMLNKPTVLYYTTNKTTHHKSVQRSKLHLILALNNYLKSFFFIFSSF